MMKDALWQLFLETGAPEAYLLYKSQAKRTETTHVSNDKSTGAPGHGLQ
jgi:hypothetical protein